MSPDLQLNLKLAVLARRLRWLTVETRAALCLLPGLIVALLVVAAHKLDRLDEPYLPFALALAVPLAAGLAWGLARPVSLLDAAVLADERLHLKERLSTAYLCAQSASASPLAPAAIRDALRHAGRITSGDVLPHRFTGPMRWSALVALLLAAAWFAPTYPLGRTPGQVAVRREMRAQGDRLGRVARGAQEKAREQGLRTPAEEAARIAKLARELERAKLSKKQALLKTGKLAQELREMQKRLALTAPHSGLAQAGDALRKASLETPEGQDLARSIREQRADELADRLSRLARDLRAGKPASAKEQQDLARDLRQTADALEAGGMSEAASALREASGKLTQGDARAASRAVERAREQASQAAQAEAEREALEQMAQELEQSQQQVAQADQKPGGG